MEKTIFLIGFMGAGKSSFGKRLAKKMGRKFLDSDLEIERDTGVSVSQLFDEIGEEGFRSLETEWLNSIEGDPIVALGGGTPCFNNNMNFLKQNGIAIYLSIPPQLLADRLINTKTKRPLIEPFKNNSDELLHFIEKTLEIRLPIYEQADITFEGHSISVKRLSALVDQLKANGAHSV